MKKEELFDSAMGCLASLATYAKVSQIMFSTARTNGLVVRIGCVVIGCAASYEVGKLVEKTSKKVRNEWKKVFE